MSWSASGTFSNSWYDYNKPTTINNVESPEHKQQYAKALLAVTELIDSGALGDPGGKYSFNVSGHANPDHQPAPGWANDSLTISISQIPKEAE